MVRVRHRSSVAVLGGAALALLGGLAATVDIDYGAELLSFMAFVTLGELFEVQLGNNRHGLGLAPALAFVLPVALAADGAALTASPVRPIHSVGEVTIAYAAGAAIALAARYLIKRPGRIEESAARVLIVAGAAILYRIAAAGSGTFGSSDVQISYAGFVAVLATALLAEPTVRALLSAWRDRISALPLFRGQVEAMAGLNLSIASVGALLALSYPTLRGWSIPLFVAPLAATQFSFRQLHEVQTMYRQTIAALSRVPEVAGFTLPGHSRRVAELSTAIAQELGATKKELTDLEYAALLHDIGRLSIPDPSEQAETPSRTKLAAVGASIVEETGYLPNVGRIIRGQYAPYRRRGEDRNRQVLRGSHIIKVASTYDDLTSPEGPVHSPWDALERLHLDTAYEYDPVVIQALMRVLEKRGKI